MSKELAKEIRIFVQTTTCENRSNNDYIENRIDEMIQADRQALVDDLKKSVENMEMSIEAVAKALEGLEMHETAQEIRKYLPKK
jgi:protein tyrosine/serine phosphatase